MPINYILDAQALEDYENAAEWYYARSIDAGDRFQEEFEHFMELICATPLRYSNLHQYYHERSMERYPYKIIYHIDDEAPVVIVSRIYHHARNPDTKYPA